MRKFLSAMTLIASVTLAHAGPKEDAYQVVEKWAKAFTDGDVDAIAKLYAPDALMIGTAGKVVMTRPDQIRKYFEVALSTNKPRTAALNSDGEADQENLAHGSDASSSPVAGHSARPDRKPDGER
jgi:hypothetical protein